MAAFVADLKIESVPNDVISATKMRVLDNFGAAVGGADNPQFKSILKTWACMDGDPVCSIWGHSEKFCMPMASYFNAMMGHTLEMDDVHTGSKTHIGTVVIPAAWALAEQLESSKEDFFLAVLSGYEVTSRIGMAFGVSAHRNMGWHSTATAGTFGAAAACGKLLGFNEDQMVFALGLAGAQSCGHWAFLGDGASCKVLNPAIASRAGVESAILVKSGMTGPEHVLTANDGGLFHLMTDAADPKQVNKDLGKVWQVLYVDNKPYPSCRSTHCAIDGAIKLKEKYKLTADQIDHIDVETYLVGYKQCGLAEGSIFPQTVVNAKFSTPFVVACTILFGECSLRHFNEETIRNKAVQELLKKVRVLPTDDFTSAYPEHWGCRVIIYDKNKNIYEELITDASGSVAHPFNQEDVRRKALSLMQPVYGGRSIDIIEDLLDDELDRPLPKASI